MALTINTVDEFQSYLNGVMTRATEHGPNVSAVVPALAGAVVLFKDSGTQLEVKTYAGAPANILWAVNQRNPGCLLL
jgi:hypothetical protein